MSDKPCIKSQPSWVALLDMHGLPRKALDFLTFEN